ncbi:hypothetical protein CON74_25635 [Bacillus thuringiensis]|uniref:hypothetical protein n=1 Tax=Bacillus thuringiensis TaxID=1428 RepID=UPI000BEDEEAB|nr:hypothetical protein [Bacillus thuringiensis]PEA58039.1 hypothetical protein CON74_25635 [Bacillus thuringiensis]HDR8143064.1 hypothetical protein [Bacillus cereus]
MIFIDINHLEISKEWQGKAEKVLVKVKEATNKKERSEIIKNHASLWGDLKGKLKELSYQKCWYCESIQNRSDTDVDHFRPKNSVTDVDEHEGYWWLAFDWKNYRHSCNFCNRPRDGHGKRDLFPLLNEYHRAKNPNDNINTEQPILLDPTNRQDPPLLWFMEDGSVTAATESGVENYRALESIKIYNLKQQGLIERRNDKILSAKRYIKDYNFIIEILGSNPVPEKAKEKIEELRELISEKAEFAGCVRNYLEGCIDNENEWIGDLLYSTNKNK